MANVTKYDASLVKFTKLNNPNAPLVPSTTKLSGLPGGVITNIKLNLDDLSLNPKESYIITITARNEEVEDNT